MKQDQPTITATNSKTQAKHRREAFWQIFFPCIIALLLLLLATGMVVAAPVGRVSLWADISLIGLILLASIAALFILALLSALIYAVSALSRLLPPYTFLTQTFFANVSSKVYRAADLAVEPLLKLSGWKAAASRAKTLLLSKEKRQRGQSLE